MYVWQRSRWNLLPCDYHSQLMNSNLFPTSYWITGSAACVNEQLNRLKWQRWRNDHNVLVWDAGEAMMAGTKASLRLPAFR